MDDIATLPYTTADRLKYIMDTRGLKQVDILRMAQPYCEMFHIKLGKNDLSQYVNGRARPMQKKLTILGLALNVSEAWLMGFDVPMERKSSPITKSSEKGRSVSSAVSGKEDALNKELISRLVQLTPAELEKVDAFVQGLLASR